MSLATKNVFFALLAADAGGIAVLVGMSTMGGPPDAFASWLNGLGGSALLPLMVGKFALIAVLLSCGRLWLPALAWVWLAAAKGFGLHLAVSAGLAGHMPALASLLNLPNNFLAKLLALAAIALLAAGLLAFGLREEGVARQQSQLGLAGLISIGCVSALPEVLAYLLPPNLAALAIAFELLGEIVVTSAIFWLTLGTLPIGRLQSMGFQSASSRMGAPPI